MAIQVLTMGILSVEMSRQTTVEVDSIEGVTLRTLIFERLADQGDPRLPDALFDDGEMLRPGYVILVDGRNAMQLGGLDLVLRDDAQVLITAHISGG